MTWVDYFLPNLTLLFIGARLFNYINWPLWVILSPLWIPAIAGFLSAFIFRKKGGDKK